MLVHSYVTHNRSEAWAVAIVWVLAVPILSYVARAVNRSRRDEPSEDLRSGRVP
jgi:hypothetical protein